MVQENRKTALRFATFLPKKILSKNRCEARNRGF